MLSQRGIAVRPGAIDFSALTGLAPSSLVARASAADTTRRIWIITGVVMLVSLIIIGIFCAVVLCLMHKKKRQRQKQRIDLGASNANHRYRPVDNMELEYGGVQELPAENSFGGGGAKSELRSDFNEVPRVQQLDGFVAAPKPSALPAELPSATSYKNDYHR
ncbi:hypothetical protein DPSP01_004345 [Paraphaeosphaeria sporulosa]|uniref:Uncharacterized protein n=1 Tax=Paraphaeosphaeria sporulosa TaxID=1460663 RepID=A0A177BY13_9PLEO|nr:uncharacterized protein CC84DRAFT_1263899 [Paraphaeosphaeria sporulosa]OAG00215.1 hypothetical protein CC84DRAFT_1263899 [Paraphaeosphaeria sporulosa]